MFRSFCEHVTVDLHVLILSEVHVSKFEALKSYILQVHIGFYFDHWSQAFTMFIFGANVNMLL